MKTSSTLCVFRFPQNIFLTLSISFAELDPPIECGRIALNEKRGENRSGTDFTIFWYAHCRLRATRLSVILRISFQAAMTLSNLPNNGAALFFDQQSLAM